MFLLTFIPWFSLIVYLLSFKTNKKRHFLHNSTFLSFDLSMFTKEDGTTIINEKNFM